jgi:hypothetical protein
MEAISTQRVFYHQHPNFVCQFLVYTLPCRALIGFLCNYRPMAVSHLDTADWIRHWWALQAHPRRPAVHDLAQ